MAKVRLMTDADGYITGYGSDNADTDIDQTELDKIAIGASKLVNGKIITDASRIPAEPVATPTAEQSMIAALALQVAELKAGGTSD